MTYVRPVEHWETLTQRSPLAGLAERDLSTGTVVACALAGQALVTWLTVATTGSLGVVFGIGFVMVTVTAAMAADVRSLFAPGVMPPLLMVGAIWVVAVYQPEAIDVEGLAGTAGHLQRVIAGVVDHATALVVGHLSVLAIVAMRIVTANRAAQAEAGADQRAEAA
ncbi:DUF6542 domain-containing protein [Solicola sp. PLA-1-18]|uniref:DUF6542 domain-containing protein n=1 Tax=Solicola sp. PLA-1-18 TaxID=3380532 RepID=UPI003B773DD6